MKQTTKALLMGALCMLIVGSAFCIAGFCFGFTFTEFIEAAEQGQLEIHFPFDHGAAKTVAIDNGIGNVMVHFSEE